MGHAETVVRFRPASRDEVEGYVAAGEWQGRAGGYAIQERGARLVESVEGDYANVVGLPVALLVRSLQEVAIRCSRWHPGRTARRVARSPV